MCAMVDSEMEGHGTVAAILIGGNECGCIGRGIISGSMPGKTIAGSDCLSGETTMINCQM